MGRTAKKPSGREKTAKSLTTKPLKGSIIRRGASCVEGKGVLNEGIQEEPTWQALKILREEGLHVGGHLLLRGGFFKLLSLTKGF